MTYKFDEDATLDAMAYASSIDLMSGHATIFGIVCIGDGSEPGFSHGGELTLDAHDAIAAAKDANEAPGGPGCRYLPFAAGIEPDQLFRLANLVAGFTEPGDE